MPTPLDASMQTKLINLDLTAIALCNTGANSRADIKLTKRKENTPMPKFETFDDIAKALEPEVAGIITQHINDAVAAAVSKAVAEKDGIIADLNEKLEKAKSEAPAAPTDGTEDVLKGVSPEVRALFEKQQSTINGLLEREQEAIAASRFNAVKSIPYDEAALKDVVKSASPAAFQVLVAAAQAIEKSVTVEPTGTDADGEIQKSTSEALYAKLEKSARDIAATKGCTFEQAFLAACEQDPETYQAYSKGV